MFMTGLLFSNILKEPICCVVSNLFLYYARLPNSICSLTKYFEVLTPILFNNFIIILLCGNTFSTLPKELWEVLSKATLLLIIILCCTRKCVV